MVDIYSMVRKTERQVAKLMMMTFTLFTILLVIYAMSSTHASHKAILITCWKDDSDIAYTCNTDTTYNTVDVAIGH